MFVRKIWPGLIGRRGASLSMALILIVGIIGWVGFQVRTDLLTNTDELLTAERSREMLLLGRGVVHDNFKISAAKPPLQYWLTSFSLPRLKNQQFAVRMWPVVRRLDRNRSRLAGIPDQTRSSIVPGSKHFLFAYLSSFSNRGSARRSRHRAYLLYDFGHCLCPVGSKAARLVGRRRPGLLAWSAAEDPDYSSYLADDCPGSAGLRSFFSKKGLGGRQFHPGSPPP